MVGYNECSIPCPGDVAATCGGNYRLQAYEITGSEILMIKVFNNCKVSRNESTTRRL